MNGGRKITYDFFRPYNATHIKGVLETKSLFKLIASLSLTSHVILDLGHRIPEMVCENLMVSANENGNHEPKPTVTILGCGIMGSGIAQVNYFTDYSYGSDLIFLRSGKLTIVSLKLPFSNFRSSFHLAIL